MRFILILFLLSGLVGCAKQPPYEPKIIYKPVTLGKKHIKKTQHYMCRHYALCDHDVTIKPRMIVMHSTNTQTLQQAYQKGVNVPYFVAPSGIIYQTMPATWMTRHAAGLNYMAIGIANVGTQNAYTKAQLDADVRLIRMLKKQYPEIDYLIGHDDVYSWRHAKAWKDLKPGQLKKATDPGHDFMTALRARLTDLEFLSRQ